ncbi:hypothetical protein CTI12_AA094730 [Artemisia annua]|uniref:Protein kinase domain-containing protein n=1 Tax=Artemisia annua TaxID=35608 RepID=A0A2U1PYZ1_ARTAN|nr:hypothetical protein CTI12_AA094730 [Artemisia annua]
MKERSYGLIIGVSIGVVIGVFLAIGGLLCYRYQKKRPQISNSSSRRAATIPIRENGVDTCTIMSDSSMGTESSRTSVHTGIPLWFGGLKKGHVIAASGILEYSYKDLQKATYNFTSLIGQGAFGPVYKAQMTAGEAVAVKVLATDSKQGEKEFQTEVMLLGRLHHRNLVNLVGYCAEKGQHMLIYVYMSKGSLYSHLYNEDCEALSWDLRVQIALDVARGLEYLHDGKRPQISNSSSTRAATIPIRENGVDTCTIMSDSSMGTESSRTSVHTGIPLWFGGLKKGHVIAASGILEYSYKDLQKATYNFTSLIGQGAFGPVYKAQMTAGEAVAVKVLATDSKQGEKEFQTEVMLLGRLHHRNLVNLVGYCAEKGQHMLIYVYMSKGSLYSHLYSEDHEALSWDLRVQIALDVARGLEYLHDGAVPPVIHRDIKSSNILLDQSMGARAAMNTEGKNGWEELVDSRLEGNFDSKELNDMATLAYKCINRSPRKRPLMRDIVQALSRIIMIRQNKKHHRRDSSVAADEIALNIDQLGRRSPMNSEHKRFDSFDSIDEV